MIAREKQMKIVELYQQGKSVEEIAKAVKLSVSSVRTFLSIYNKQKEPQVVEEQDKEEEQVENEVKQETPAEKDNEIEALKKEIENLKAQIETERNNFNQQIQVLQEQLSAQITHGLNSIVEQIKVVGQKTNNSTPTPQPEPEVRMPQMNIGQPATQDTTQSMAQIDPKLAWLENPLVQRVMDTILSKIGQPRQQQQDPLELLMREVQKIRLVQEAIKGVFPVETTTEPMEALGTFINNWVKFLASLKKAGIDAEKIIPNLVELTRLTEGITEKKETKIPVEETDIE